jgi:hypothetical protein
MPEGVTFPKIDSFEPLVVKFTMLWYSSNMEKKWQSNTMFCTYYLQLKRAIESIGLQKYDTLFIFHIPFVAFISISFFHKTIIIITFIKTYGFTFPFSKLFILSIFKRICE